MTYTRPVFYYGHGTNNFSNYFGENLGPTTVPGGPVHYIKGLNGQKFAHDGYIPTDVFPELLDTTLWDYDRIEYPASTVSMNLSIEQGVQYVINKIKLNDPPGPAWAVGGYSQGGAVAHRLVAETKAGRLVEYRSSLKACVTFGSPTRETGHTNPVCAGWSGAVDVPDSTTGGHGIFPHIWPFLYRIVETDSFVWDFVMPGDPITAVGDSTEGTFLSNFVGFSLNSLLNIIPTLLGIVGFGQLTAQYAVPPEGVPVDENNIAVVTDADGTEFPAPGGGHVLYPWFPPPGADGVVPTTGDTCYQLAAQYLNDVGQQIYDQVNPGIPEPATGPVYSWSSSW